MVFEGILQKYLQKGTTGVRLGSRFNAASHQVKSYPDCVSGLSIASYVRVWLQSLHRLALFLPIVPKLSPTAMNRSQAGFED